MYDLMTNRLNMGRLFNELTKNGNGSHTAYPHLNIWEEGDKYWIEAEVPGFEMKDLDLAMEKDVLTISGNRDWKENEKATYHRRERAIREFSRSVTFPVPIDADKVQATLANGILTIELPLAETAKPKKIQVKAAKK